MSHNRFSFGLSSLKGEDWRCFEQLASQYLAIENPKFRTQACPSGDGGRDSELLYSTGNSKVMAQFSLEKDWVTKIRKTVTKITKNFDDVTILLYLTNQEIGALGDELKNEILENSEIILDIRDINWFVERESLNREYENAAEVLCRQIVDPILQDKKIAKDRARNPASSEELESAYYFITLENESSQGDKNLTDITFEGVIKSILRNTNSETQIHRQEIIDKVTALFPEHKAEPVVDKAMAALERLHRRDLVSISKGAGTYGLSFLGAKEQREKKDRDDSIRAGISTEIVRVFTSIAGSKIRIAETHKTKIISIVENVIQSIAVDRGWRFASAIACGEMEQISEAEYAISVNKQIGGFVLPGMRRPLFAAAIIKTIGSILSSTSPQIQAFLRSISISHTLLFLTRQTPDSQKVIQDLFLSGKIWLDTNVILPIFAETLSEDREQLYSEIFSNAVASKLELFITSGVLEEIDKHFSLCLTCWDFKNGKWDGEAPYLLRRYIESGSQVQEFGNWVSRFRGNQRPVDDLLEYLHDRFSIVKKDHSIESSQLGEYNESVVKEAWNKCHLNSRFRKFYIDDITALRLAKHDIENFIGIIVQREGETLGHSYQNWWLTLDKNAFRIFDQVRSNLENASRVSPIMSIDFLTNYLILGPNRRFTNKNTFAIYPVFVEMARNSYFSDEIITISNQIRQGMKGVEDRVVRRAVRDAIDKYKSEVAERGGPVRVVERLEKSTTGI